MALERERLRIAVGLEENATLTRGLQNYQARVTTTGNTLYGAAGAEHDDLLVAVALTLWGSEAAPSASAVTTHYGFQAARRSRMGPLRVFGHSGSH